VSSYYDNYGDPTPTTGGPVDFEWAEGCVCHYREDVEYGDLLTAPPGGCPVHSCTCLDNALGRGHSAACIHTTLNGRQEAERHAPKAITQENPALPGGSGSSADAVTDLPR
jgi:hypothetical protein